MKIYHGGRFTDLPRRKYVDGEVAFVDLMDIDQCLDIRLRSLASDTDIDEMLKYVHKHKIIYVYVEHDKLVLDHALNVDDLYTQPMHSNNLGHQNDEGKDEAADEGHNDEADDEDGGEGKDYEANYGGKSEDDEAEDDRGESEDDEAEDGGQSKEEDEADDEDKDVKDITDEKHIVDEVEVQMNGFKFEIEGEYVDPMQPKLNMTEIDLEVLDFDSYESDVEDAKESEFANRDLERKCNTKAFRAKAKAHIHLKGDANVQYSLLRDYVHELKKRNPNTTLKIDIASGRELLGLDETFIKRIKIKLFMDLVLDLPSIYLIADILVLDSDYKEMLWKCATACTLVDFNKNMDELKGYNKKACLEEILGKNALGMIPYAIRNLCGKLKFLKVKIRAWYADYRNNSKGSVSNFKEDLRILDDLIDKGNGSDEIVNNRLKILGKLQQVNKAQASEVAQKAKDQMDIVNEVQIGFHIGETNHWTVPFILNEIMQWCRRRKKQSLIFKVDFEKAYNSVRWDFLDDILVKFGFGIKWRGWIQNCLNSSKGSILSMGVLRMIPNLQRSKARVIKVIHGPEGGLITDVRRGFRSTWTSIVQEVKKLQNQEVGGKNSTTRQYLQMASENLFFVECGLLDVSSYEEWYTWLVSLSFKANLKGGVSKASSIVYGVNKLLSIKINIHTKWKIYSLPCKHVMACIHDMADNDMVFPTSAAGTQVGTQGASQSASQAGGTVVGSQAPAATVSQMRRTKKSSSRLTPTK
ncbi:RNA-directed DNA polymerase, eukaryota, reverse transcriptase zinc-binding domain protein [Tanacetum coccineum]